MQIDGQRKKSLPGWIDQTEAFYGNLLQDAELMTEMAKFGYTDKKLSDEFSLIKTVADKNLSQKQEKGKAQESTEQRDLKFKELEKWISGFRAIAKVALADTPQKLEKLGITVSPRKTGRKPKEVVKTVVTNPVKPSVTPAPSPA